MSDFDYGNARLHGMKARLLRRERLESLAATDTVSGLLNALIKTEYQTAVERALVQFTGLPAFNETMRLNQVDTMNRIRHFFPGKAVEYLTWIRRRYDVDNIKTILRGVVHQLPADEIVNGTLPIGEITPTDLSVLARAGQATAVIDLLATWRVKLAEPILALQAERAGATLFEMEVALEQWYVRSVLFGSGGHGQSLREVIMQQADATNILTALRLVGVGGVEAFLQAHYKSETAGPLFVGPGTIPLKRLVAASQESSIEKAVAILSQSPYHEALATGLAQYSASQRLAVFEQALIQAQRQQASNLFIRDPLGIGVLLGYLFLKTAEIANLRRIAHGLQLGHSPEQIRAGFL
jgi:V/A-type H+-transporting ATPase subunit C